MSTDLVSLILQVLRPLSQLQLKVAIAVSGVEQVSNDLIHQRCAARLDMLLVVQSLKLSL